MTVGKLYVFQAEVPDYDGRPLLEIIRVHAGAPLALENCPDLKGNPTG